MHHFSFMARFNAWVNEKLYACVGELDEAKYRADSGLFFGSVHATLNHLLVVDRLWTGACKESTAASVPSIRSCMTICPPFLPAAARRTPT